MGKSMEAAARLACFELWGGNRQTEHSVELPGLQGWISSNPGGRATSGGDVHYFSVCSKGQISRIALADVAGHGEWASGAAERLRGIFQQHTDNWDQSALMRELNEAFRHNAEGVQFATAVVLGFYSRSGGLLFTNAGHLPLLWHHAKIRVWEWLEDQTPHAKKVMADLPLGLISGTNYVQTAVDFEPGDLLLLYTDGITELRNETGKMLGPEGLLQLVRDLDGDLQKGPVQFGQALEAQLRAFRGSVFPQDDTTLLLIQRETGAYSAGGSGTNDSPSASN